MRREDCLIFRRQQISGRRNRELKGKSPDSIPSEETRRRLRIHEALRAGGGEEDSRGSFRALLPHCIVSRRRFCVPGKFGAGFYGKSHKVMEKNAFSGFYPLDKLVGICYN